MQAPRRVKSRAIMYIIALAWLYVALLAAVTDTSVVGGVLTFLFWGVAPLSLFLWLVGTPARRRRRDKSDEAETSGKDRTESANDQ